MAAEQLCTVVCNFPTEMCVRVETDFAEICGVRGEMRKYFFYKQTNRPLERLLIEKLMKCYSKGKMKRCMYVYFSVRVRVC